MAKPDGNFCELSRRVRSALRDAHGITDAARLATAISGNTPADFQRTTPGLGARGIRELKAYAEANGFGLSKGWWSPDRSIDAELAEAKRLLERAYVCLNRVTEIIARQRRG